MANQLLNANLLGALLSSAFNMIMVVLFWARIYNHPKLEYWLGIILICGLIPLTYLLVIAFEDHRPIIYFIQLVLMIAFLIVELLLDYILKIDFRSNRAIVIPYVTLFYASFGGMIGVAKYAGKGWLILSVVTFLSMTAISIYMHIKTGK